MRGNKLILLALMVSCTLVLGKGAAPAHHSYRIGKAPKAEFKVAGKSYKIDPDAKSAKAIRV